MTATDGGSSARGIVRQRLRAGSRIGKYKILRKLGRGGFADVYAALDTIEGSRVALKIPHAPFMSKEVLEDFYREVRLAARLDHPNILALKTADLIDGRFVVATALGEETLADRLSRRMAFATAMHYAEQALEAVAYAHDHRVIHCDLKPDNFILFPHRRLRLADFGIAKVALKTVKASGSGTLGYVAPEQAMGKPSQRSDVFSLGLILWRLFSGKLPEWPFTWPLPGVERLETAQHPELIHFLRRAIEVDPRKRFRDGSQMLTAFKRIRTRALRFANDRSRRAPKASDGNHWQTVRVRQFQRRFRRSLETHHRCEHCAGPVAEAMTTCPWCARSRPKHRGDTRFPASCPRCGRGVKLDWRFCAWCYGPGFERCGTRSYSDVRYTARCANPRCPRRDLMPFMRYCPWCRRKVRRAWPLPDSKDRCPRCRWGVTLEFWSACAWCGKTLEP